MAVNEPQLIAIAAAHLPDGAELAMIDGPYARAAVFAADLNGDRVPELAVIYRLNGELHLLALAFRGGAWTATQTVKGIGFGVAHMAAIPIMRAGVPNLTVGWRIDATLSKLSVYEWTREGLRDAAPAGMSFSSLEAMDMPDHRGADGKTELALWTHAGAGAYQVEIMRWTNGAFQPAPDAYRYYFPKVVLYYDQLTRQYPERSISSNCRQGRRCSRSRAAFVPLSSLPRSRGPRPYIRLRSRRREARAGVMSIEAAEWRYRYASMTRWIFSRTDLRSSPSGANTG
ncbi:hypothetical protein [Paenibacillus sacheonensis]|uniref:hypothetical protein n=1 Tax=Paenibacillus sacheonensis TaxID=742054 RepID=UPI0030845B12|nr:hypothetical protein [Paenibacillus sacheonensis]